MFQLYPCAGHPIVVLRSSGKTAGIVKSVDFNVLSVRVFGENGHDTDEEFLVNERGEKWDFPANMCITAKVDGHGREF